MVQASAPDEVLAADDPLPAYDADVLMAPLANAAASSAPAVKTVPEETAKFTTRHWHRPVNVDVLRHAICEIWGESPLASIITSARRYFKLRAAMSMHQEVAPSSRFVVEEMETFGDGGTWAQEKTALMRESDAGRYLTRSFALDLPASALHTALLLNVHGLSPLNDQVPYLEKSPDHFSTPLV